MTFQTKDAAFRWALINGKDNCLPCHKWNVEADGRTYRVAIRYRSSNQLVGFAY